MTSPLVRHSFTRAENEPITLKKKACRPVCRRRQSVMKQPKSKREDKEAENELHVGGLRRPSQTLYLVTGWESTGRRLWDCIDTALSNDTDASGLTRLYGQADFQGPPLELVEKVRRAIQKKCGQNSVTRVCSPFRLSLSRVRKRPLKLLLFCAPVTCNWHGGSKIEFCHFACMNAHTN